MERLLRFGISKNSLEKQYKKIWCLPFPETPESDELYDLFSELVELDCFIMGAVSSYLEEHKLLYNLDNCDREFNDLLRMVKVKSKELDSILSYKNELDKLIALLMEYSIQAL